MASAKFVRLLSLITCLTMLLAMVAPVLGPPAAAQAASPPPNEAPQLAVASVSAGNPALRVQARPAMYDTAPPPRRSAPAYTPPVGNHTPPLQAFAVTTPLPFVQIAPVVTKTLDGLPPNQPTYIVYYDQTTPVDYQGGSVVLSTSTDGSRSIVADDALHLIVTHPDNTQTYIPFDFYTHDWPAVDISAAFQPGLNQVRAQLIDLMGPQYSAPRPFYLVMGAPAVVFYDPRWASLGLVPWMGFGGEPVATGLGSFYTQHQDLHLPGRGLAVDFTRAYNSLDPRVGSFGRGGHYSYDMSAIDRGNGEIIVTFADGRAGLYTPDGSGGYTTPTGFFATLTQSGGQLILTDVDQTVYVFNGDGTLHSITDANGNQLRFAYSSDHTTLTDTVGRTFRLDLNGDRRITQVTDPSGRVYRYDYDGDRLIAFHDAAGGIIRYAYNGDGLMTAITDPNNHTFVTNTYDGQGRVVAQQDAAGSTTTFVYQDNPRATTITDNEGHATVHRYDDQYRLIQETDALGHSLVYQYDSKNNRTYVKDRNDHETHMQYDDRGNLLQVIDALNQTTTFQYDAHNNLTYHRDAAGAETTYIYDPHDNLTRIQDALTHNTDMTYDSHGQLLTLTDADGHTTTFTYDGQGNLQMVRDALTNLTSYTYDGVGRRLSMTDANNHTVHFAYDNNDRITSITDARNYSTGFVYDPVGNLLHTTDRRGFTSQYVYDVNDSLVQMIDARGNSSTFTYDAMYHRTSATNGRGYTTQYVYDAVYNLIQTIDAKNNPTSFQYDPDRLLIGRTDPLNHVTALHYDALHRVDRMTDALNGVTTFSYDPVGRLTLLHDPKNGFTHYQYDPLGRLTQLLDALNNPTVFTYDPAGNRTTVTNARNITTTSHYDAVNRLIDQIDPLGTLTQLTYDGVGNVLSRADANGNVTHYQYDANDNLTQVRDALNGLTSYTYDEEANRLSATDANNHPQTFTYDPLGNLLSAALPLGQITRFTYDQNSNLTAATNAKNNTTQFAYDPVDLLHSRTSPLGLVTSYDYDAARNLTRVTDADNHATQYGYDALDRLTTVIDALNGHTGYQYDPLGNLTAITDANNHSTAFGVDLLGRVTSETNPLAHSWNYVYDAVGNRTRRTDANGAVTNYTYDARNRLTQTAYPSGPNDDRTYDGNGNLLTLADASGAAAYTYDALNRLTLSKRTAGLMAGQTLSNVYDPVGNRTRLVYPDGKQVNYTYNANDWLTAVQDLLQGATSYTLDADGLPTHQANPNGTWTDRAYDRDDRLTTLFNGQPGGSTGLVSSFAYTLDGVGNITHTAEKLTRGQVVAWNKSYTYDPLNRLTNAVFTPDTRPYQVLTAAYTYDPVGNRLSQTTNIADTPNTPALPAPVTTNYTYDAANEMLTAGTTRFGYDNNGNRTSEIGASRVVSSTYDFENRLVGAQTFNVQPNGRRKADATLDYTYDGLGRRLERGVRDQGVRKTGDFLYDGLSYDLLAQFVTPGSPRTTYYYRDLTQILSRHEIQGTGSGLQYFYHYDALGNVSAWTNQSGHEDQEYMYAPYGRPIDNNGPDNSSTQTDPHTNLAWAGKPWDQETALSYYGARDYDPATGTWLTQDSYRGRLEEPGTLHRYGYVGDNPTTLVDRYGYDGSSPQLTSDQISTIFGGIKPTEQDRQILCGSMCQYGTNIFAITPMEDHLSLNPNYVTSANGVMMQVTDSMIYYGTSHGPELHSLFGGSYLGIIDEQGNLVPGLTYKDYHVVPDLSFAEQCTLFSCDTWSKINSFSHKYDKQIRLVADVIGWIPIAGGLWKENILYATGKETTNQFIANQALNIPLALLDLAGAKVFGLAMPELKGAVGTTIKYGSKFLIDVAKDYVKEPFKSANDFVAAGINGIASGAIDYLGEGLVEGLPGILFPRPAGRTPVENWAGPVGQALIKQANLKIGLQTAMNAVDWITSGMEDLFK